MTQTIASDSLTGTNWTDLHNHSAELGGQWVRNSTTGTARWYLYGGQTHCGVITPIYGAALYLPVVPASADYSVFCDYEIKTMAGHVGLAGRMVTNQATYYFVYADAANVWVLGKYVNNALTILNNSVNTDGIGTYELELRMTGTTIAYYVDGVLGASETDSSITAAGRGGVRSASVNDASTGKHIDNFRIVDGSTAATGRSYALGLIGI